jgi:PKD repeat protein
MIIGIIAIPALPRAQAVSAAFPYVRGWDGILPTESTADLQATFTLLQQRGYNAARISLVDPVLGVSSFDQTAFNNLLAIAKQHNIWLIMDDHEYGITDEAAWLSFWAPIITAYKNEPMIIWQPRNEPSNSAAQLSTFYQDWINQDRNLGDNHWIIVSISYSQYGAPNDSTFLSAFPTVTDPLNQVAYDFHDYYFYQYHPAWSLSDAQAYAANVPAAVLALEAYKNAPAIVSEFGADASGGGPSPPDVVDPNCSCQYSVESLAYVVAVIQGLDNIGTSYGLWEAGDWDGSGLPTGAMNVWGQTIPTPAPSALSTSSTFLPSNPIINSPVTFTAVTTGGAGPYTISWNFGDGAKGTGATVTHTYTTAQSFTVSENATDSSSPSQTATSSNSVTISPPPPLSTSFALLPPSPVVNTPVTFTAMTIGGTSPYLVTWNFGDGTSGTGSSVIHTFTNAQSFTVTETATDSSTPTQTATNSRSITVLATPPLSTTFQVSSSSPQVGQIVTFTASATGGTAPYTYVIAFGDGATGTGSTTTHAYSIAGSYTAKVTVTDSASPKASITASKIINVQALTPPTLSVPGNQTIVAGTWINFTITAASLNTGGTISLSATGLPAGASFNQATGVFSWKPSSSQIGSYTVVFTAVDSSYPSTPKSKTMEIQVNQAAPGGSNGGSGGSGGNSNGSCTLCGIFPRISTNTGLLLVGGFLGLLSTLVVFTIRTRISLGRTKRRMEIRRR